MLISGLVWFDVGLRLKSSVSGMVEVMRWWVRVEWVCIGVFF